MSGDDGYAQQSEQRFWINKHELLQISKPRRQNQRGCLRSVGPLYFL